MTDHDQDELRNFVRRLFTDDEDAIRFGGRPSTHLLAQPTTDPKENDR